MGARPGGRPLGVQIHRRVWAGIGGLVNVPEHVLAEAGCEKPRAQVVELGLREA